MSNTFTKTAKKLTPEDIADVEGEIGFLLPGSLRAHYLATNGGIPERRYYLSKYDLEVAVKSFLSMKYPRYDREILFENYVKRLILTRRLIPKHLLPFAIDEGQDFFCMDLRDESVVFFSMESAEDLNLASTRIADSLSEFVEGMITRDELEAAR